MQKAKYTPTAEVKARRQAKRKALDTKMVHGPQAPLDWILQHGKAWKDYR